MNKIVIFFLTALPMKEQTYEAGEQTNKQTQLCLLKLINAHDQMAVWAAWEPQGG